MELPMNEKLGWVLVVLLGTAAIQVPWFFRTAPEQHLPKFTYGQCFVKMGLREPWDLDVAGRVYSRGYTKYLVMYADEANRVTLAPKASWEEDITTFDSKYQVTPCPETWRKHTHGKSKAEK
jgi:hypothetical protein